MTENSDTNPVLKGVCNAKHEAIKERFESGEKKFDRLSDKIDDVKECVSKKMNRAMYALIFVLGGLVVNLIYMIINNHGK